MATLYESEPIPGSSKWPWQKEMERQAGDDLQRATEVRWSGDGR